jgi:hypothetical protein
MRLDGKPGYRFGIVFRTVPETVHLVGSNGQTECELRPSLDHTVMVIVHDTDPDVCEYCAIGRRLRRETAHRERRYHGESRRLLTALRQTATQERSRIGQLELFDNEPAAS